MEGEPGATGRRWTGDVVPVDLRSPLPSAVVGIVRGDGYNSPMEPDYDRILAEIAEEVRPLLPLGAPADYIPALARVPRDRFGMAVRTLEGRVHAVGDASIPFSIQSISKVFTFILALRAVGDRLWDRIQREPSGDPFNSPILLEQERGIPRNPFINAGALVVADILLEAIQDPREELLRFLRARSGSESVRVDPEVAESERSTGHRNAALAYLLKSFGNLRNRVEEVLDFYFFQCSLEMDCRDLASSFLFLANRGLCPVSGERILEPSPAKRTAALMLTCGTYDAVGDFVYRVGLPAKSGVGGGIAAILPGRLAAAVWSPGLNSKGNSLAGTQALELFTTRTGISIF